MDGLYKLIMKDIEAEQIMKIMPQAVRWRELRITQKTLNKKVIPLCMVVIHWGVISDIIWADNYEFNDAEITLWISEDSMVYDSQQ